ncbi:MAG: hypothetical protein PHD06_11780 [Bacteroidales bacterium]|nr:hypothetical protein [Bacteroidales bacterium]
MKKITVKHYLNTQLKAEIDGNELYYPLYISITVSSKNIRRKSRLTDWITVDDFNNSFKQEEDTHRRIKYEADLIYRIVRLYLHDNEKENVKYYLMNFFTSKGYNSKDNFINGLNAYIDYYSYSIFDAVQWYCTNEIEKEIYNKVAQAFNISSQKEVRDFFQYKSVSGEIDFIYNNVSRDKVELLVLRERLRSFLAPYSIKTGYDIPLKDWLDGLIQKDLKKFLTTYEREPEYYLRDGFVIDNQLIEKYLKLIDDIINSPDYFDLARKDYLEM